MAAVFAFSAPQAYAATDQADLSVGLKTLPLLTEKVAGMATLAIVFDPANRFSEQEANGIKTLLNNGLDIPGDIKLNPVLVSVSDLGKFSGAKIAVLTNGLQSHFNEIESAAAKNSVLTMSTDLSCVESNKCILGIVSKPHVEIYYSKAAADAANISFVQAFTMLAKGV